MDEDRPAVRSLMRAYEHITQRDLDQLNELQRLLGDPGRRVEIPHAVEGIAEPMPASTRYRAG